MNVVVSAPGSKDKWSVRALWDTGASVSVISKEVSRNLGLEAKGCAQLRYANGVEKSNVYKIDLELSRDIFFNDLFVRECDGGGNFEMVIGMDIISRGDFKILNRSGKTFFEFEID